MIENKILSVILILTILLIF